MIKYIKPRLKKKNIKFTFWSDSVHWFGHVLSSTSDPTGDLNFIQVDPNQCLGRASHEKFDVWPRPQLNQMQT